MYVRIKRDEHRRRHKKKINKENPKCCHMRKGTIGALTFVFSLPINHPKKRLYDGKQQKLG